MSTRNDASRWLFGAWFLTSIILFFVWFGSTIDIPKRDEKSTQVRNAKAAAKGFGVVTLLLPILLLIIVGIANLFK